jgi:6-phosphogluconolactonase/glucosamine-6-phosphate isomerase/deaminase
VSGKEKAGVISAVFNKPVKKIFPVQYIDPEKSLWIIDKAAAGQ